MIQDPLLQRVRQRAMYEPGLCSGVIQILKEGTFGLAVKKGEQAGCKNNEEPRRGALNWNSTRLLTTWNLLGSFLGIWKLLMSHWWTLARLVWSDPQALLFMPPLDVQLPLTVKSFLHFDVIECIIMTLGCPPEGLLDASLIKIALTHEDNLDRWAIWGRDRSSYCDRLQSWSGFGDFRKVLIFLRGQQVGSKLFLNGFQELIWEVHHASWNSAEFFYNVTAKIVSKRVA